MGVLTSVCVCVCTRLCVCSYLLHIEHQKRFILAECGRFWGVRTFQLLLPTFKDYLRVKMLSRFEGWAEKGVWDDLWVRMVRVRVKVCSKQSPFY